MTQKEMKETAFRTVYDLLLAEYRGGITGNGAAYYAAAYQSLDLMTAKDFQWLMDKAKGYVDYEKSEERKAHKLTEEEVTTIRTWFNDQMWKAQAEQVEARNAHDKETEDYADGRAMAFACTKYTIRSCFTLGELISIFSRHEAEAIDHLNDRKWHNFKYGKYEGFKMIRHYLAAFEIKG